MTFRHSLLVAFTHVSLLCLVLGCLAVTVSANTPTVRQQRRRDSDVVECWDGATGQISTQQGACK